MPSLSNSTAVMRVAAIWHSSWPMPPNTWGHTRIENRGARGHSRVDPGGGVLWTPGKAQHPQTARGATRRQGPAPPAPPATSCAPLGPPRTQPAGCLHRGGCAAQQAGARLSMTNTVGRGGAGSIVAGHHCCSDSHHVLAQPAAPALAYELGAALGQRGQQAVVLAGAQRLEELGGIEQQQGVACGRAGRRAGACAALAALSGGHATASKATPRQQPFLKQAQGCGWDRSGRRTRQRTEGPQQEAEREVDAVAPRPAQRRAELAPLKLVPASGSRVGSNAVTGWYPASAAACLRRHGRGAAQQTARDAAPAQLAQLRLPGTAQPAGHAAPPQPGWPCRLAGRAWRKSVRSGRGAWPPCPASPPQCLPTRHPRPWCHACAAGWAFPGLAREGVGAVCKEISLGRQSKHACSALVSSQVCALRTSSPSPSLVHPPRACGGPWPAACGRYTSRGSLAGEEPPPGPAAPGQLQRRKGGRRQGAKRARQVSSHGWLAGGRGARGPQAWPAGVPACSQAGQQAPAGQANTRQCLQRSCDPPAAHRRCPAAGASWPAHRSCPSHSLSAAQTGCLLGRQVCEEGVGGSRGGRESAGGQRSQPTVTRRQQRGPAARAAAST